MKPQLRENLDDRTTNQASTADLSRYAISHKPLSAPPDHGEFHIELEGRDAVVLKPNQAFSVPAGMLHRPVVPVAARSS